MITITKWLKWEWIKKSAGGYLSDYTNKQLFAEIHYELVWYIELHRRYDKIILNKEYQIQDIGAEKSFTEVI